MSARVYPNPFPPACTTAWGDDCYGLWCEITVNGVVQRLRWIEPGTFWMGSTDAERERFGAQGDDNWRKWIQNEAPRHRVRMTQGFWLADTACTEALWNAVLGGVFSNFGNEEARPVKDVSWNDVTMKFFPALMLRLPMAKIFLPTEAQWEYACRAGTTTAYHFGDSITSDQMNFDSDITIPVKARPANRWGLYQMHGNVREWCADARRTYTENSVTDPDGGQVGFDRALRGGSWLNRARGDRCAFRDDFRCSHRNDFIGFRFALR